MSFYVIVKASRLYSGGPGYSGPACSAAKVKPGQIYLTASLAKRDAAKLSRVNLVGFFVREYVEPRLARVLSAAYRVVACWRPKDALDEGDLDSALERLSTALRALDDRP